MKIHILSYRWEGEKPCGVGEKPSGVGEKPWGVGEKPEEGRWKTFSWGCKAFCALGTAFGRPRYPALCVYTWKIFDFLWMLLIKIRYALLYTKNLRIFYGFLITICGCIYEKSSNFYGFLITIRARLSTRKLSLYFYGCFSWK